MSSVPHIVIFPFMSKGHTIPLLHLAQLLVNRNVSITVFTTKENRPFIARFLHRYVDVISIVDLPFPTDIEGIPRGIESTDKLPSMSLFFPFATATKRMQPCFEEALEGLENVICVVSDGFLSWTLQSANKLGIPRLSFFGMNGYSGVVSHEVGANGLLSEPESDDESVALPSFPWIKVARNDFAEPFNQRNPTGPHKDFIIEVMITTMNSYGLIMNTFYELEPLFIDYLNREPKPKAWCVGPLCLADPGSTHDEKPKWVEWLDEKLAQGGSVLYVAFGSQMETSREQLDEIATGLDESEVNFLWVVRNYEPDQLLVNRASERGMIVNEWVDQREILNHESVNGFLSHCGWNSVLESICSKVPILAWPMMAEQPLNAMMIVEEIKIGLRVETCNGFVKSDGLTRMVKELMEGEKGNEARKKVEEFGEAAKKAVAEGGSSWRTLNELIDELEVNSVKSNGEA